MLVCCRGAVPLDSLAHVWRVTLCGGSHTGCCVAYAAVATQDIEDRLMMLRDAVLDDRCQLSHDPVNAHDKNLYG